MNTTIHARVKKPGCSEMLDRMAEHYSSAKRSLYRRLRVDSDYAKIKPGFMAEHSLTSRQFNAIRVEVLAAMESERECRKLNHDTLASKLDKTIQNISSLKKKVADGAAKPGIKAVLAAKTGKRLRLQKELATVVRQIEQNESHLCFGSRKLFNAQHHLKENGYASHAEWLTDWRAARDNQFFVLGSSDESAGCQGCKAVVRDAEIVLLVRTTEKVRRETGQAHFEVPLPLSHRRDEFLQVLALASEPRKYQKKEARPDDFTPDVRGHAISYRFICAADRWHCHISFELPEAPKIVTSRAGGGLGLDFNHQQLALTQVDRFGNMVDKWTVDLPLKGASSDKRESLLRETVAKIVAHCRDNCLPLITEKLDFAAKKKKNNGRFMNELLHHLPTAQINQVIVSACFYAGVEWRQVNPAYTSKIGAEKYAEKYGLSGHHAAALVIARRGLGFGEKFRLHDKKNDQRRTVRFVAGQKKVVLRSVNAGLDHSEEAHVTLSVKRGEKSLNQWKSFCGLSAIKAEGRSRRGQPAVHAPPVAAIVPDGASMRLAPIKSSRQEPNCAATDVIS